MSRPYLSYFDSVYIAFFNSREYHQAKGRDAVISKFGMDGWKKVKGLIKPGLMAIFNHPPIPETEYFVNVVAEYSDRSAVKRNARRG